MTIPTITVASLKKVKNTVIGNPLAKIQLVRDSAFISTLINCLNPQNPDAPPSPSSKSAQEALRIEAAHVVASLSYGSEEALGTLLQANTHHAFLYAISHFTKADSPALRAAFSRALRALVSSLADVVGPSLWGLKPDTSMIRNEARQALEYMFQIESLDIYLPLLVPSATGTNPSLSATIVTLTAQILSTTVRTVAHRRAVSEWLPPAERQREIKSRRGWEKTSTLTGNGGAPWVARQLVSLLGDSERERDSKLVEAALLALAALSKENATVANYLEKPSLDRETPPPLATILAFSKSRSIDVQLAACLCLTHTLRATSSTAAHPPPHAHLGPSASGHPYPTSPTSASTPHPHGPYISSSSMSHSFLPSSTASHPTLEENCTRTVMNVVNRMIATPHHHPSGMAAGTSVNGAESPQVKTRACFVLHYLVTDDAALCHAAFERGCLEHLGALIHSITPTEPAPPEWEEDEPESISCLREAALTALASLALSSDDIRRRITDELRLLPCISRALRAKRHTGTRYAACQCVRAMSRAVSVLRTTIVDSGLGMDVLRIVLGKELGDRFGGSVSGSSSGNGGAGASREGKKKDKDDDAMDVGDGTSFVGGKAKGLGEDRRVLGAALSAMCNIVNDFSPLRPIYLEENLMPRLVCILRESGDPALRLNALWAVKNLIRKTSAETKRDIMSHLGWQELLSFFADPEEEIQEQSFNVLRNLAENEDGIAMVFRELGPRVISALITGMHSANEDVVLQSTFALANLANGSHEQQELIVRYPGLLSSLQGCLAESTAAVRRPAVSCVLVLAQANPKRRKEMAEVGIVGTLRRLCEWSGHAQGHPHGHAHGHASSISIAGGVMGLGPTTTAAGGGGGGGGAASPWGGRSPIRSPSASSASAAAGGVYGSWGGSGTLHQYHSHSLVHPVYGHGGAAQAGHGQGHGHGNGMGGQSSSYSMVLDDDRDVVQRARMALEWLEHGEVYVS